MKTILFVIVFALLLLLVLPLSNFFIQREYVAPSDDAEFKLVSDTMVKKCADCHSSDMAPRPVYFNFPIAHPIIESDLKKAKSNFVLSREKLSGASKFTSNELFALSQAMAKNNMPPARYIALYWDAALSEKEQRAFVSYIKKQSANFDLRPIPQENFFQPDKAKVALGERLFSDKRLSGSGKMSCANCHSLESAGCDQKAFSVSDSMKETDCNTPTVFNAAYNFAQNWNAGAKNLKEHVQAHIVNERILNAQWATILTRLSQDQQFLTDFSGAYADGLSMANVADAIAAFEQTLLSPESRFDSYLKGDASALTKEEKSGLELFKKHNCVSCHLGPSLGGQSVEKFGIQKDYFVGGAVDEPDNWGRFNVSRIAKDKFKFKVPNLRNIELSGPYFHDGSAKTLRDAVHVMSEFQIDKKLSDNEEILVCKFLRTLTGEFRGKRLGTSPQSK